MTTDLQTLNLPEGGDERLANNVRASIPNGSRQQIDVPATVDHVSLFLADPSHTTVEISGSSFTNLTSDPIWVSQTAAGYMSFSSEITAIRLTGNGADIKADICY